MKGKESLVSVFYGGLDRLTETDAEQLREGLGKVQSAVPVETVPHISHYPFGNPKDKLIITIAEQFSKGFTVTTARSEARTPGDKKLSRDFISSKTKKIMLIALLISGFTAGLLVYEKLKTSADVEKIFTKKEIIVSVYRLCR